MIGSVVPSALALADDVERLLDGTANPVFEAGRGEGEDDLIAILADVILPGRAAIAEKPGIEGLLELPQLGHCGIHPGRVGDADRHESPERPRPE